MSPSQADLQLRTPRSDMVPLADEPNNYENTPLASSAALPIPSSTSRQWSNHASSIPSSSSVSQSAHLGQEFAISEPSDLETLSRSPQTLPSELSEPTPNSTRTKSSSHVSRKPHKSRSNDAGNNAERHDHKRTPSTSIPQHPKGNLDASARPPGHPAGPVRGRPLIFAAMASAEAESFVPFLPEDLPAEEPQPVVHRSPSTKAQSTRKEEPDPSQDYPSPRSPSPPLHKRKEEERPRVTSATSKEKDTDFDRGKTHQSPVLSARTRTVSLPGEESRVKRDAEHVHRSRKLSGSSIEARLMEQLDTSPIVVNSADELSHEAESAPVEDTISLAQPQQASLVQPEPSSLGSPVHLRHGRSLSESRSADAISPPRSRNSHRERDRELSKSRRRSRDGIKLLTEKQLERLNSRTANTHGQSHSKRDDDAGLRSPRAIKAIPPVEPPTPISPEDYHKSRSKHRRHRSEKTRQQAAAENEAGLSDVPPVEQHEPTFYPLAKHLVQPALVAALLPYLSFPEWCALSSVNKDVRKTLFEDRALCEVVLERYLKTVGYARWSWPEPEPLALSLAVSLRQH